jgi:hypothetical protein
VGAIAAGGGTRRRSGRRMKARGHAAGEERRKARGSSAKWRGMGLPLPSPWIYRSKGATLPGPCVPCALTASNDVHHRRAGPTTPKQPGMRACANHYGAATEGPRRPITSAPMSHTARVAAPSEKAHPRRTTTATTVGIKNDLIPYHVCETLGRPEPKARKKSDPQRVCLQTGGSKPRLARVGSTSTLESRGLLISSSRVGLAASP